MPNWTCCFKEQRYKFFESNSQLTESIQISHDVVSKSKDTSFLKAIHNEPWQNPAIGALFQRAKIQVFWKQFTTSSLFGFDESQLFQRAKIQVFWKQFTTGGSLYLKDTRCFKEQRYKFFESNSQPHPCWHRKRGVVSKSKDTSFLKAIHNFQSTDSVRAIVVSKSKDTSFLKAIHNFYKCE